MSMLISWLRCALLFLGIAAVLAPAATAATPPRELLDHVVRYVNGQAVTRQQLRDRVRIIDEILRRQGQSPTGDLRSVTNQLMLRARDELTE
jgi:hypothetical protein